MKCIFVVLVAFWSGAMPVQSAPLDASDFYGIGLQADAGFDGIVQSIQTLLPGSEVSFAMKAADLPATLADPAYFHLEMYQWSGPDDGILTAVSCTRLGRISVQRLSQSDSFDLNGALPNFRLPDTPLRDDAFAIMTCLIQFQTMNPMAPFDPAAAVAAMADFPGQTEALRRPEAGTAPGDAGWVAIDRHTGTQPAKPGLLVDRLQLMTGMLGQDITLVVQLLGGIS